MADMGIPIVNVSDYCALGLRVVLELADSGAFACGASRVWTGHSSLFLPVRTLYHDIRKLSSIRKAREVH